MTEKLEEVFGAEGSLASLIDNYRPREVQMQLAKHIEQTIIQKSRLVAEAGTGTGKTFAYLVPAILSGKKVLVTTGTKNLQDQLFFTDIPLLRKALGRPFRAMMLKGRANYLCPYRLDNAISGDLAFGREQREALARIQVWGEKTTRGDIAELAQVPESSPVWQLATSTTDNCLGQDCGRIADCYLAKARKEAQDADVLIINHHLLCADWLLRDEGFGELLPDAECIVVDEAHQLAHTASQFLGLSVSSRRINGLLEDTRVELDKSAADMDRIYSLLDEAAAQVMHLRDVFGEQSGRQPLQNMARQPDFESALQSLSAKLTELAAALDLASERSKGLDQCWRRAEELVVQLAQVTDTEEGQWICWYELFSKSYIFHRTPLDVSEEFGAFLKNHQTSWVFTSATLTVAGEFDHFTRALGLGKIDCHRWESPFDYASNSLFYHPRMLPFPSEPDFTDRIVEFALPVLEASRGRAFFLFTSYRAMHRAADLLKERLEYPLLVQGSEPKTSLLKTFRQQGNAVLMGTASFWEGVDVRGSALSCVIIDKLPFAAPGDPVLSARLEALREQGEDPFDAYQIPQAVITLNQGIGRLIRDVDDRGVLMICDPRLLKKRYGQVFLDSVPPMKRTREIEDVRQFFHEQQDNYGDPS